ncbi:MAG: GYF domain-containing protein [Verrucomicrobiales bacterium]|nr:GYF domain-containing protein [Verrucomicrobiales bacterium]
MSSEELPEHQIFHILRNGEQEPIGPYSQNQLVELLNTKQIKSSDFVYYPELKGWKPMSQVFDFHQQVSNFGDEGQDPHVVTECFNFINSRSEPEEEIYYIAVQELPALSLTAAVRLTSPRSMIITNHRFCILNPKLMGAIDFDEYPLDQIVSGIKKIKTGKSTGIFNIVLKNGDWVEIDKIPLDQLAKLEQLSKELLGT